ncbi:MAG: PspC domain-containing protein [Candidatus Competibacteraceae bacterium]|nr:PspC domain-containing protein [Candidatus Competibacteraceae bacterium]
MNRVVQFFEKQAFGVCNWWGDKLGIDPSRIRLYFIYASFATMGSWFFFYLIMAFVLKIRNYTRPKRTKVWDL